MGSSQLGVSLSPRRRTIGPGLGLSGDDFSVTNVVPPIMPYVIVRESYINNSCLVDGLPLNEVRLITEKSCSPSQYRDERSWRLEFSTESYNILNALEQIGYKVITSSSFVTGHKKFDTKDYIWTLYRPSKCDIDM